MKNTVIIGILCIGIGFGAAKLLGPGSDESDQENAESQKSSGTPANPVRPAEPSGELAKSDRPETPSIVANGEEADPNAEGMRQRFRAGQDRFRKMMEDRQRSKEEAKIKKLIDRLGLTDAQAEKLRARFAKNREELTALMSSGEGDWTRIKELTKALGDDQLDDALADILTDEQKDAYEEMKERDLANRVEARAYKDLAQIQGVLDLNPDQKDQVYEILHKQAAENVNSNKDANAIVASITEGFGLNINPEDLGIGVSGAIQGVINRASNGEQPSEDRGEMMQAMQESRQREIDTKVELLAPVLDDGQEETYRNHLESQGAGLLGGLLQGGAFNVEGIDIQAVPIPPVPTPAPAPSGE